VHTKHGRNYPGNRKRVLLNRALSWLTNAIVPVSDNASDVALRIEKVNSLKLHRIWNGVDTALYKPQATDSGIGTRVSESFNSPPSVHSPRQLTIGTVARLSPEKDQQTMLKAFRLVVDQLPNTRLAVVGDGPCREDLRNEANRLGIAGQVDFLGACNDVAPLLHGMSVFTLSSSTEGISMTILEAMACEVPIVASDVGGNREIVQPPECGLIVPARDSQALAAAYLELLRNPAQRSQMGAAGRQRVVKHFSLQRMVADYTRLYEELLTRKGIS